MCCLSPLLTRGYASRAVSLLQTVLSALERFLKSWKEHIIESVELTS
jgi:hypothetical protein